jgi:hypothetical protein
MDAKREATFFERLIDPMLDQLRRIASTTKKEYTVEDLKVDAFIFANDYQQELGVELEPENEELQKAVLKKLWKAFGKFANRAMRTAFRLDQESVDADGERQGNSVAASLIAPDTYEPEVALERAQEYAGNTRSLNARFCESIAYLRVLDHFDNDKAMIARHLAIHARTLDARLSRAEVFAKFQPSVFDGIEVLPDDFFPRRGLRRRRPALASFHRLCEEVRPWQAHLFSQFGLILLRG